MQDIIPGELSFSVVKAETGHLVRMQVGAMRVSMTADEAREVIASLDVCADIADVADGKYDEPPLDTDVDSGVN